MKLVILSGPSCVGKGPLRRAIRTHRPEIQFGELTLCNSRKPRLKSGGDAYEVHGVDYYFLPRSLFEQLDRSRFVVGTVRSDLQAIDMAEVHELLGDYDLVLAEVFHTLGKELMDWAERNPDRDFEIRSVFLSPLSEDEIQELCAKDSKEPEQVVFEVMRAKLERRGEDAPQKIEERAQSAWSEMQDAASYTDHIVCHAGEDDRGQWAAPLGAEAERVLNEFVRVLVG